MTMKSNESSTKDSKKGEQTSRTNLILYCALAVVVVFVVAFAVSQMFGASYRVSVKISTNTTIAYPFQTSYFLVNVTNKGNSSIRDLNIGFYLNGSALHYSTLYLPAGASAHVIENYTYPAEGNYLFLAVVDPAHVLNIKDRNYTQSSTAVEISPPSQPNIYASMPSNNITYTESFTLTSMGLAAAAATASKYNVSIFNNMFTPAQSILVKLFENLYVVVNAANGAYVKYSNNTAAYSMWIQGRAQPSIVDYLISSFYLKQHNTSINGTNVRFAIVNNKTSMCYLYSGGWTKIFTYFNNSNAGTCLDMINKTYTSEESNTIVAQIKANRNMTSYQEHFFYTNSTAIGSALVYNNGLSVVGFFENHYGFFANLVQNTTAFKGTKPLCRGLIYTNNAASVCSVYVLPTSNATGFGMVNTTELTPSYRFSLYSLVNQSDLSLAHVNGAALLDALNVTNVITWKSTFKNTCAFTNTSIGCNATAFDYYTNIAQLTIENKLANALRINTLSCFAPGLRRNQTINTTVAGMSSANVSVACINLPIGNIASMYTNYALAMNYTYMNVTHSVAGVLNVTNQGLS